MLSDVTKQKQKLRNIPNFFSHMGTSTVFQTQTHIRQVYGNIQTQLHVVARSNISSNSLTSVCVLHSKTPHRAHSSQWFTIRPKNDRVALCECVYVNKKENISEIVCGFHIGTWYTGACSPCSLHVKNSMILLGVCACVLVFWTWTTTSEPVFVSERERIYVSFFFLCMNVFCSWGKEITYSADQAFVR